MIKSIALKTLFILSLSVILLAQACADVGGMSSSSPEVLAPLDSLALSKPACRNSSVSDMIQLVKRAQTGSQLLLESRRTNLEEDFHIQSLAFWTAMMSTFLAAMGISILVGAGIAKIGFRLSGSHPQARAFIYGVAILVSQIYLFVAGFMIVQSSRSTELVVNDLKTALVSARIQVPNQFQLQTPQDVRQYFSALRGEMRKVPQIYWTVGKDLPSQGRWWTFGWEELHLVNFEIEAVRTLLGQAEVGKISADRMLTQLTSQCLSEDDAI